MKKSVFLLMSILLLSACGPQGNAADSSTNSSKETAASVSASTVVSASKSTDNPEKSSTTGSTAESSGKTTTASTNQSTTASTTEAAAPDAFNELQQRFPDTVMPSEIPRKDGSYLNIASTSDSENLSILYYEMDHPLIMNHKELNQAQPAASFKKTTYQTAGRAKDAVNYIYDDGGQEVDLGHNIKGYVDGAAGSSYLSWKEGNWSLTVRASNVMGQDPVPTAKEVVEYLEKAFLPVPKSVGQITIDLAASGYEAVSVVWQKEQVVYTVTNRSALPALQMAVSTVN